VKAFEFLPDEGVLRGLYSAEIPTLTPIYKNVVARACLGYKYANYTSSVNMEDFQTSSKWKPESRILNNALAVTAG